MMLGPTTLMMLMLAITAAMAIIPVINRTQEHVNDRYRNVDYSPRDVDTAGDDVDENDDDNDDDDDDDVVGASSICRWS